MGMGGRVSMTPSLVTIGGLVGTPFRVVQRDTQCSVVEKTTMVPAVY